MHSWVKLFGHDTSFYKDFWDGSLVLSSATCRSGVRMVMDWEWEFRVKQYHNHTRIASGYKILPIPMSINFTRTHIQWVSLPTLATHWVDL
jgi:hypothetical protein